MFADKAEGRAVPGMIVGENGQLLLAMFSDHAVGVSLIRYDRLLSPDEIGAEIKTGAWVAIEREHEELYFVNNEDDTVPDGTHVHLHSPLERESAQFAIEVALLAWPEWSKDYYRRRFKPTQLFMPFRKNLPEA